MSDRPLPRPVSATDLYLAALLDEIRGLRDDLKAPPRAAEPPAGMIELREPQAAPVLTPLPDDFPGKTTLEEAGIIYLESVPRNGDDLVKIRGIGKATAGQILVALR